MRRKLFATFGRTGSVMLTVGITLLLISLTPPIPAGHWGQSSCGNIRPGRCEFSHVSRLESSQIGLRVSIEANASARLMLLDWDRREFSDLYESWLMEQSHNMNRTQISRRMHNLSVLEEFLQANPGHILALGIVGPGQPFDFFPARSTNVTLVLTNPSPNFAHVSWINKAGVVALAPRDRTMPPASMLIVSGVLLQLVSAMSTKFFY